MYDPISGRWTTEDPLMFEAGDVNLNRYVGNNPTNHTDPTGLLEDNQKIAISGVKAVKVEDKAGPDATDWFARDIVDHIRYRATQQRDILWEVPTTPGPKDDVLSFRNQAKYLMAPKWADFGSPKDGKGVNTVVIAGKAIRKNQLGNMEFAIIGELLRPKKFPQDPVRYAYLGDEGARLKAGSTYSDDHPYKDNFGEFKGVYRADNLAAFGVGHGIAKEIDGLPIMAKIRDRIAKNKPILDKDEQDQLVKDVTAIITNLFSDPAALQRRVNKYHSLLEEKVGEKNLTIPIDALFFIPDHGGFNTTSLTITDEKTKSTLPPSRLYFEVGLRNDYKKYEKALKDKGEKPLDIDAWLREYHENYRASKQKSPP